jgi:Zn-ribbon protein, possibly nucleic acid-binding
MSLPKQLYQLQQIDLELRRKQQMLSGIEGRLRDNKALAAAEAKLASQKQQLANTGKELKSAEWELEDLQERVNKFNSKLYGGTTRNPKELVSLESEVKNLRNKIKGKEDRTLELMSQVEELEAKVKTSTEEFQGLKQEWQRGQETLNHDKTKIEAELIKLGEDRQRLAQQIDPEALRLYEQIRLTKEQAVARVEQGRCLGCRISLPISQWQKAKAGNLIQCSSCNRILYLE